MLWDQDPTIKEIPTSQASYNQKAVYCSGYKHRLGNRLLEFKSWLLYLVAKLIASLALSLSISIIGMTLVIFS